MRTHHSQSHTVATLNARYELRKLRMLVGTDTAAADELDRLEVMLSEALHLTEEYALRVCEAHITENYVGREEYDAVEREADELSTENTDLKAERDEVREKLDDLLRGQPDLAGAMHKIDQLKAMLKEADGEISFLKRNPLADRVHAALYSVHPGTRAKTKLAQYEKIAAAVRAALKGRAP
jgi:hypothetical protein